MKRTFFITGTDTGVGKTVLTALLAAYLREQGIRVAALKPVCSGGREDARALHGATGGSMALDEINPWYFRAPIAPILAARREKQEVRLGPVLKHIRAAQAKFDIVLVEGAGGLLSPLGIDFDSRDLISALAATPLVVAPNRLGAVNHIILTLEALPKPLRAKARVILIMPPKPDSATASNPKLLEWLSVQNMSRLPWFGANEPIATRLRQRGVRRILATLAA